MTFTPEQTRAVHTRAKDLLVSAAAGSGKTSVLAERVIHMITDEARPVGIERLLVVTFTEAAAAEMKGRVRKSLARKIKENPRSGYLKKQELLIEHAAISTIHAFCRSVIRDYFHLIDLDPDFKISDETEAELLKADVMKELLSDLYEGDEELNARVFGTDGERLFFDLVEIYGDRATDGSLGERVMELLDFSRGEPWPEAWLTAQMDGGEAEDEWRNYLAEDIKDSLEDALEAACANAADASSPLIHPKYAEVIDSDAASVRSCVSAAEKGLDALYDALGFEFGRLSTAKVKGLSSEEEAAATELKEHIKSRRDNDVKAAIAELRDKIFIKSPEEQIRDGLMAERAVRGLCGMALELGRRFQAAKREKNLLDFSDLEHYCIEILVDSESGKPTEAALELSNRFDEIFVDEYQDSNAVQELIVSSIAGGVHGKARNMFMVGDVKQSIYRFRLANADIFNEKYERYGTGGGEGELILLSKNFRSRKSVLDAVNAICSRIMSPKLGGCEYTEDEALSLGAGDYGPDGPEHVAELIAIEDADNADGDAEDTLGGEIQELSNAELEAAAAAARIKALVDGPEAFMITADNGTRPARYRDIAVILRSPRSVAEAYVKVFREYGVPAASDVASGYFDTAEVLTALSFLRIIDNPRQDIPLAAVLYSQAYGLTAADLLMIRAAQQDAGDFYDAVIAYVETGGNGALRAKLEKFVENLNKWRGLAAQTGVSDLLLTVLEETGLYLFQGLAASGAARQANLRVLHDCAAGYEKTQMRGLFHFLRYIDSIIRSKKDSGAGMSRPETADAVTIMSIHKSKGLEFPVVIVCGMGRKFNLRDAQARLVFHNRMGIGTMAVDLENRVFSDTLKRRAISKKLRQESVSEELRVLYVAMTRAKEKLILIGRVKDYDKIAKKAAGLGEGKLPYRLLKKNERFIDFIIQGIAAPGSPVAVRRMTGGEIQSGRPQDITEITTELPEIEPGRDYSGRRAEIMDEMYFVYPHITETTVPGKLSVTEIKRLFPDAEDAAPLVLADDVSDILREPEFLRADKALSAPARGTALHTVLERLDFSLHQTAEDIAGLTAELTERRILLPEEAAAVDVTKILLFLKSPLARRIRQAGKVWRERPFVISVPASDINPAWRTGEIMVHGIIDCLFLNNEKLTLSDYKTGRFTGEADARARYGLQMSYYKKAAEALLGMPVDEVVLYYFDVGREVKIL
ncbi:MAG: helicase-exonuclease AddAB subunit AddA [Clostridiales bacterium]|jgi:ATP-dependent helicase/nuclease subunit A|nr:helicase-exonuclease AddAB subunit AddA [Clostridiales bacterium]